MNTRADTANPAPFFWLPLLAREMRTTANKKRYFRVRGLYTLLFFAYFGFEGYTLIEGAATRLEALGSGALFFQKMYSFQVLATLIFVPAIVSGAIAWEKERGSLQLLLTTDLSSARILLQKFFSCLAPMLAMQLCALPLGAFAYALGGLTFEDICVAAALLWTHTIHATAFSLACSAWCRTSVSAFTTAYVGGAVLLALVGGAFTFAISFGLPVPASPGERQLQFTLCGALLALSSAYLIPAMVYLRPRAEARRSASFYKLVGHASDIMRKLCSRLTGARVPRRRSFPGGRPVKWRELRKRALSRRQTITIVVSMILFASIAALILGPVLREHLRLLDPSVSDQISDLSPAVYVAWALLALVLTIQGANIVASERTQQTLDILLSTPIRGSDIIVDKAAVARNIGLIAMVPLVVIHVIESLGLQVPNARVTYVMFAIFTIAVLPPFVFWFAVLVGLHVRSRFHAVIAALFLLFLLSAIPFVRSDHKATVLSPAAPVILNEIMWNPHTRTTSITARQVTPVVLPMIISLGGILIVSAGMRTYCLIRADRLLGRAR